jgi:hypothetical protein
VLCLLGQVIQAETMRVATFAAPLTRDGPGLLLRDIMAGDDPQIAAALAAIHAAAPDILVLTQFDHDGDLAALSAFAVALAAGGTDLPHVFSALPNAGMATGFDMDGDGTVGEPRDAQGYGRFAGAGGLAVLSRWPIDAGAVRDLGGLLWRDLPGATLPVADGVPFPSEAALAVQRLSSTGHWIVPVMAPGGVVELLVWSATPPVFDGPEDRNGLRNRDELRLWTAVLDGAMSTVPGPHFVIAGNANLDPADGEGLRDAMAAFLADPRLTDPRPASAGGATAADPGHAGDPGLDTADWTGPGNLRVSYVLPAAAWEVTASGVLWPDPEEGAAPLSAEDLVSAGPHRLVWVDITR